MSRSGSEAGPSHKYRFYPTPEVRQAYRRHPGRAATFTGAGSRSQPHVLSGRDDDEAGANAADPVLSSLPEPGRRETLIAVPEPDAPGGPGSGGPGGPGSGGSVLLRFDIRLQGDHETVFFDV